MKQRRRSPVKPKVNGYGMREQRNATQETSKGGTITVSDEGRSWVSASEYYNFFLDDVKKGLGVGDHQRPHRVVESSFTSFWGGGGILASRYRLGETAQLSREGVNISTQKIKQS